MRILEIRRHTMRQSSGSHLTQAGVDLARRVGNELGQFDRVITSTLPRAFETAIAMGYAVDEQIEQLGMMNDAVTAVIPWNAGYTAWLKAAQNNPVVARYTQAMADLLRAIVRALPENGGALIISHGGIVEAGTIGCLPAGTYFADDAACGYCEGARLTFNGNAAVNFEMLRADQPR